MGPLGSPLQAWCSGEGKKNYDFFLSFLLKWIDKNIIYLFIYFNIIHDYFIYYLLTYY